MTHLLSLNRCYQNHDFYVVLQTQFHVLFSIISCEELVASFLLVSVALFEVPTDTYVLLSIYLTVTISLVVTAVTVTTTTSITCCSFGKLLL